MAYTIKKTVVPVLMLALSASGAGLAQNRAQDRARDPAADQDRISDQQRIQDRSEDRLADQDRLQREQDRVAAGDQPQDRSQEQLRLELHVQDQEQFRNRDIFGSDLMTREERSQYRERIQEMDDDDEWLRFRAEHQARMLERAREQGVELPAPFFGQQLMTDRERERLRERLEDAESQQERERILAEHREQMQARAREHRVQLSELEQRSAGSGE